MLLVFFLFLALTRGATFCNTSAQCFNASFYCDASKVCLPFSCRTTLECAPGFICSFTQRCIPSVATCSFGAQCPVNFYCSGYLCLPLFCTTSTDCTRFNNNSFCSLQRCYPVNCIENQQCPPNVSVCNLALGLCTGSESGPTPTTSPVNQDQLNLAVFVMLFILAGILVLVAVLVFYRYRRIADISRKNDTQLGLKKRK